MICVDRNILRFSVLQRKVEITRIFYFLFFIFGVSTF